MPTWVCRSNSPEGEFLRGAGIDKHWVTSSGYMNCVSASGKLLGGRASPQVLAEFHKLPEAERRPGAVQVRNLEPAEQMVPATPTGGLVLKVHARFLTRSEKGELRQAQGTDFPLMADNPDVLRSWQLFLHPNTEYMWLTREEWQALVPAKPAQGDQLPVAPAIAERMARFHLTPRRAMTSEGGILGKKDVQSAKLTLVVDEVTPERIRLSLHGFIHTGSTYDAAQATTPNGPLAFGFETPLQGVLEYDRVRQAFTRFDIVASGEVWGRWGDANGKSLRVERPGRTPFAFAFELAKGDSPADRIPPGGNGGYISEKSGYFPSK